MSDDLEQQSRDLVLLILDMRARPGTQAADLFAAARRFLDARRIRTNPTMQKLIETITYLERVAQAASALIQYDKAVSALAEGTDEGALSQAQSLFDASFDTLETALTEWRQHQESGVESEFC